ncbi:MvdC/MvdD family ATP grasp protein, partial [Streptomyces lasiicapitis]|uniref:MvdC/MvdD family ATP grasp protein n=1 Tax=Streptomyces lasiicapitis TaxID=1923961 RepID=UPI0036BA691B
MACILVIAAQDDWPTDRVVKVLAERGAKVFRMDTAEFPQELTLAGRLDAVHGWHGQLSTARRSMRLADVTGVYYRSPNPFTLPAGMSDAERRVAAAPGRGGGGGGAGVGCVTWGPP